MEKKIPNPGPCLPLRSPVPIVHHHHQHIPRTCNMGIIYICCYCCCSVTKSCPTFCDPMDCSPPGSSVHGILQARILKWVTLPSFRGSSQHGDQTHISYVFCIGRWVTTSTTWKTQMLSYTGLIAKPTTSLKY